LEKFGEGISKEAEVERVKESLSLINEVKLQKSLLSLFIGKSPTDAPVWNNAIPHKSEPLL
jgi:hypothetical protein